MLLGTNKKVLDYMPLLPNELVDALNFHGFWNGRAKLLMPHNAVGELPERWGGNPWVTPFGGLFVVSNRQLAAQYAQDAIEDYEGWYGGMNRLAEPMLHKITLLHGAEVALDEDLFGWFDMGYLFAEGHTRPWNRLASPAAARHSNIEDEIEQTIEKLIDELDNDPETEDWFDPEELRPTVVEWTEQWAIPILSSWTSLPKERKPEITLRITNDRWIADPPYDKLTAPSAHRDD